MTAVVLGFDIGGTGARAALAPASGGGLLAQAHRTAGLRRGPGGVDGAATAAVVADLAAELLTGRDVQVAAAAVGCAGAADLGADLRAHLPGVLDAPVVVVCSDLVTAFLGALGSTPGVTLAVGTGVVAVGSDLAGEWRRADGWGDLVGDLGGGAWLGRAGLTAALRAFDGRRGGSRPLLAALTLVHGDPGRLIGELYTRADRASLLAAFAPEVLRVAGEGDEVASGIRTQACTHLAEAALAARPPSLAGQPMSLAVTGGLLSHHDDFREELLALLRGDFTIVPAAGTPCDGAVRLAATAAHGPLPPGIERLGAVRLS